MKALVFLFIVTGRLRTERMCHCVSVHNEPASKHTRGRAVSPLGLRVTDGSRLKVREAEGGWQQLNIFMCVCVCALLLVHLLMPLLEAVWLEGWRFPKWCQFELQLKDQLQLFDSSKEIKMDVCAEQGVHQRSANLRHRQARCSHSLCERCIFGFVSLPPFFHILPVPALDRHARVQPDTQAPATRLSGWFYQRQQRRQLVFVFWWGWRGQGEITRRKRWREEGQEGVLPPRGEQGQRLGRAFR